MFTSRAEYRLILRQDNADMRLSQLGYGIGLLPEKNYQQFQRRKQAIQTELTRLKSVRIKGELLEQVLRRPKVRYQDLPGRDESLESEVIQQVEIEVKYAGYIDRQDLEIEKFRRLENKQIPAWFDYTQ